MSGGNQQKVVIAKWLATEPPLLIIDEPTRGIDVGTKAEVHRLLSELAGQGLAILMISSELPEVLGMADRVLVVCEGRLTADLDRAEATPEAVMHAATATHADQRRRARGGAGMSDTLLRRARARVSRPGASLTTAAPLARDRGLPRAARSDRRHHRQEPGFLFSGDGWRDLLLTPSILILLAVGQTVVIITRNVDLSVGSMLGADGVPHRRLFIDHPGLPDRRRLPRRHRSRRACSA